MQVIPVGYNGTITVPADLQGFSFGMVVSTNETVYTGAFKTAAGHPSIYYITFVRLHPRLTLYATADQIIAGPVAFHDGFKSSVSNPGLKPVLPNAVDAGSGQDS